MGADNGLWIVQAGLPTYEWDDIAIVMNSDPSEVHGRNFITKKMQRTHANLIAAAPEMYEALQNAVITLEQVCEGQHEDNVCCHHLRDARAALAKAEGKTS
ncbi:hypothetical protein [Martelella limonii]|uniref:hypothetical protein n=1 Tax=Martelella limonii TaxID=1647649 RepID=UPI00157FEC23|nr:hypothetical protein [Martelella limonii]